MNCELPDFKLDLEKAEEPGIKLPTSAGSSKKQEGSRKTSTSALLTTPKPLIVVDHNKLWKILREMGTPDHLTHLLRNLCAGQEATVRTGRGTMDWFSFGEGVCQGHFAYLIYMQRCSDSKESSCNVGDLGSTPGLGRSPGGGHGSPLQYSGESS